MSYFKTRCPACGAEYMTGMVGTTLMGSHDCPKTADERHIAWLDEQKRIHRPRVVGENQQVTLDRPIPAGDASGVTPPDSQNTPRHTTAASEPAGSPESSHGGDSAA